MNNALKVLYYYILILLISFQLQACENRHYQDDVVNNSTLKSKASDKSKILKKNQKSIEGKVVGISDGDTFSIVFDNGFKIKVRLNGIDCPERKQPFSKRAKTALSDMIFEKIVKVDYEKKDRYGRVLGWVYVEDLDVNAEMIKRGMAWHFKKYSSDKKLAEYENIARKNKIGLWVDANPIAPWDYRKKKN